MYLSIYVSSRGVTTAPSRLGFVHAFCLSVYCLAARPWRFAAPVNSRSFMFIPDLLFLFTKIIIPRVLMWDVLFGWSALGLLAFAIVWVALSQMEDSRAEYRRYKRSTPPSSGSIQCLAGVQGAWGRVQRVWQRPPTIAGGPAWFTGGLDCIPPRARMRFDVVIGSAWPLNNCPERATRGSLIETQSAIDRLCDAAKIESAIAVLNIETLPTGAPLLVRGDDILRSVLVGPEGRLGITHDFAIQHRIGRIWGDEPPFAHELYVAWTQRSPDGSILFSSVDHALKARAATVPTARTSRVVHGDTIPVPDMPDARLELRSLARFFAHMGPWEVALVRGPFPDTYSAAFGSAISMVTHPPPTPIVAADNNAEEQPDTCLICLEALVGGEPLARLRRCGHTMHGPCLQAWLTQRGMHRVCPMCRTQVPSGPTARPPPLPLWERYR